ncbi:hypothetical protein GCM10023235_11570 [Kitasatospora terrestris]|uniref:Uncharacterized protein n=1 Tax=Kitasatospora terrestris TaxID=258051 RepID=A0ABP9DDN8_9ACTN
MQGAAVGAGECTDSRSAPTGWTSRGTAPSDPVPQNAAQPGPDPQVGQADTSHTDSGKKGEKDGKPPRKGPKR